MPTVAFVVGLVLLGTMFVNQLKTFNFGQTTEVATIVESERQDLSHVEGRDPSDLMVAGPVDAPVTLVVFADYQCPYTAPWNEETLPTLMKYADAGDLRIEWRTVDIFGEDSQRAARAAHAAAMQDRYWDFHNALYPAGGNRSEEELSQEALLELADSLGLDSQQLARDMESDEAIETLAKHQELGDSLGVAGTPIFVLDGELMAGGVSTSTFVEKLDKMLGR